MQRSFSWLAAIGVVIGTLVSAMFATVQKGDSLIVPGKGVGEIKLGMEPPEVERRLGQPAVGDNSAGTYRRAWFGKKEGGGRGPELDIKFTPSVEHDKIAAAEEIRVESPLFHTKEGVSTKSDLSDIWKTFPDLRYVDNDPRDGAVEIYGDHAHGLTIEVRRTRTGTATPSAPTDEVWGVCQAIIIYAANLDPESGRPSLYSMRDQPDEPKLRW